MGKKKYKSAIYLNRTQLLPKTGGDTGEQLGSNWLLPCQMVTIELCSHGIIVNYCFAGNVND